MTDSCTLRDIITFGKYAALEGKPREANPYFPTDVVKRAAWFKGYDEQRPPTNHVKKTLLG